MTLDLVATTALAGLALYLGHGIRRVVPAFARLNVPPPLLGGLAVALAVSVAPRVGVDTPAFDTMAKALARGLMAPWASQLWISGPKVRLASNQACRRGEPLSARP